MLIYFYIISKIANKASHSYGILSWRFSLHGIPVYGNIMQRCR